MRAGILYVIPLGSCSNKVVLTGSSPLLLFDGVFPMVDQSPCEKECSRYITSLCLLVEGFKKHSQTFTQTVPHSHTFNCCQSQITYLHLSLFTLLTLICAWTTDCAHVKPKSSGVHVTPVMSSPWKKTTLTREAHPTHFRVGFQHVWTKSDVNSDYWRQFSHVYYHLNGWA